MTRTEPQNKKLLIESSISRHFRIHSERPGRVHYTKPIKRLFNSWGSRRLKSNFTIDFVLEPLDSVLSEGWELGCVGVEAKPSQLNGSGFGRAVSQILDYQASKFTVSNDSTEEHELSMIFLLGPNRFHGTEASILMQEGIGLIHINDRYPTRFLHGNGMHPILTIDGNTVSYRRPRFGMGIGHR